MDKEDPEIIYQLSQSLEIDLPLEKSSEELKNILAEYLNDLINHDFNKLLRLLYKIDVSEKALKEKLNQQNLNGGMIVAEMIIERQLQKIKTKEQFKSNSDIPENEKW
ncbi:MAG TPA: hypothetical protein VK588_13470 [Chitinophagaceae bacterium]|nr:hypothetical protein [Chitinophagaceae bacterium]